MRKAPQVISAYEQELANKIIYQDSIKNAINNEKNIEIKEEKTEITKKC